MNLPSLYILLLLVVISSNGFSVRGFHLPLPNDIDGEDLGEVVVNIKENGARHKRSADGVSVPAKIMDIAFTLNESTVDLHLERKDEMRSNVPIFTMDGKGALIKEFIKNNNNIFFYQDKERFAAFYVETSESSSCLFGTFEDQHNEYFLEPKDLDCSDSHTDQSVFRVLKIKHRDFQYSDYVRGQNQTFDLLPDSNNNIHSDVKRSVTEYKIEMLLIIDYSLYNYWYSQSKASTTAEKDTDAKFNIRQYYAWVINGMDVRYKNIQTAAYKISIVYSGIFIADTAGKSGFTEYFKDSSSPRPGVDSGIVLTNVTEWVQRTSGLPAHDHAMMFTRYDLKSQGSSSNKGLAWVSQVCKSQSVSIVEDDFDFVILTVAAHELGHSLSASHDGEGNGCNPADTYIMAPSAGVPANTNPWKFSSCSTTAFTTYINSLNNAGTNCMTSLSPTFDPTALKQFTGLPGQVYDVDGLCKHIVGPGSSFCRFPYKGNYSSLCLTLWCWKTDGSGQCSGATGVAGLQCGNKKLCSSGVCTYDVCAPQVDDSCLFGDDSGVVVRFQNGDTKTCADVASNPSLCYYESVKSGCCKTCPRFYTGRTGCEYGDKVTGCSQAYCPQYKDTQCCGYCYTGPTITTVPTPTEDPNLCRITTYKQNTQTSTINTMMSTIKTNVESTTTRGMSSSTISEDKTASSVSPSVAVTQLSTEERMSSTSVENKSTSSIGSSLSVTSSIIPSVGVTRPITTNKKDSSSTSIEVKSTSAINPKVTFTVTKQGTTNRNLLSSTISADKTRPSSTSNVVGTQPSTTKRDALSSTTPADTTTLSIGTNLEDIIFTFVVQLDIIITEDLSNTTQYFSVKENAEVSLTELYRIKLGDSFKSCNVTGLKKGSLIVDYDVYTKSVSSATANIVSVNQDLVSGKANMTYNGQTAPVSSMAFKDSSGRTVNFTSTTSQCEVLEATNPCKTGSKCVEEQNGPVCRFPANGDIDLQHSGCSCRRCGCSAVHFV